MHLHLNMSLKELNNSIKKTMVSNLGIEILKIESGYVKASMPVDERTMQPMGILHGGANLALAETVSSLGSILMIDHTKFDARGAQISANHLKAVSTGTVVAEAEIVHRGQHTHLWNVYIRNDEGQLVSTCRATNFIVPR